MKIIYGLNWIKKFKRAVVAIGVFDGVHHGHRIILEGAVRKARAIKGTSVVLTFWPDPHRQQSLYSLEHRLRLIQEIGIDVCIVLRFNRQLARLSPQDFVKNILFKRIGADYICVGKNFKFGEGAEGNFKTLEKLSRLYKFKLKIFDMLKINHQAISSTYIRKLITEGNLNAAKKLLFRPVSILGTVIKGVSLARRLGFPTANIDPHHEVLPPSGVYTVKITFNHQKLKGICYIGIKPTFNPRTTSHEPPAKKNIEVYIFNFKKNIYGKYLEIQFVKKIREEKRFVSHQALVEQVKKDIAFAKTYLSHHK